MVAEDVSRKGLFVVLGQDSPPVRTLLQLEVDDGGEGPFRVHAMVASVRAGRGAGLKLFALSGEPQARWDALVRRLTRADAESRSTACEVILRPKSSDELRQVRDQIVSEGVIAVACPRPVGPGAEVRVIVRHPSRPAELAIKGVVAECSGGDVRITTGEHRVEDGLLLDHFLGGA